MRLGRSMAAGALAAVLMSVGFAMAAGTEPAKPLVPQEPTKPAPPAPAAGDEEPHYPPGYATKVGTTVWKPAEMKPEHGILQALAGKFTTKVHLYAGPFPRMMDTEGVAEGKILVGGPFVEVTHSEKRMKDPFDGQIIFGFDVATRKFVASAIGSDSTAMIQYFGNFDAAKKQLVLTAHYSEQKSRQLRISKIVITLVDANNWTYDEYISTKVGDPEIPVVTISFKR
jgi:hypothetical protein